MDQKGNSDGTTVSAGLEQVVAALSNGIIVIDRHGHLVAMDDTARRRFNGDAHPLTVSPNISFPAVCVRLCTAALTINGEQRTFCVVQEQAEEKESSHDLAAAIEAVMSDSTWLTRTIVDKIKAWRQARQPTPQPDDLDMLTDRERDILALICDGRSDVEMGRVLGLSQNTVRNHVASLYRKIGVNRRSAAIIWARERGLTSHDVLAVRGQSRSRRHHGNGQRSRDDSQSI